MAQKKASVLKAALNKLTKGKTAKSQLLYRVAELYAQHVPEREVRIVDPEDMATHFKAMSQLMAQRKPKDIHVAVHNPSYTPHTVVEVLMDDQAFLIDSVWMKIQSRKIGIHHSFHPVFTVQRTPKGALKDVKFGTEKDKAWKQESLIHIEVDRQSSEEDQTELAKEIKKALTDAQNAYQDFTPMTKKLEEIIANVESKHKPSAQREENTAFMRWLLSANFIFLGYRYYEISYPKNKKEPLVQAVNTSGKGILRQKSSTLAQRRALSEVAPNIRNYLASKNFLTVTKTLQKAPIHRQADMDYIGIREYDEKGRVCGEHRFVGLFTSQAYTMSAREIPIVGQKIRSVLAMEEDLPRNSYNYKSLQNILEMYPRDELFQMEVEDLHRIATGIMHLQERQQVRVFLNRSASERQISVLVYLPLERMSTPQRLKIQDILMEAVDGESIEYQVRMGEGVLARLFFKIRTKSHTNTHASEQEIEAAVAAATLGWVDNLRHLLIQIHDEDKGLELYNHFEKTFAPSYQEITSEILAAQDIKRLQNMTESEESVLFTLHYKEKKGSIPRLRVFNKECSISLSSVMPLFDNMGLTVTTERSFKLHDGDDNSIWLHDFELVPQKGLDCTNADTLTEALRLVWQGKLENDCLNALIVKGQLTIQELVTLRMLVAYLRQVESRYGREDVQKTLIKHAYVAKLLAELFEVRFNPSLSRKASQEKQEKVKTKIANALKDISILQEDRILQKIQDVILATLRTNAWQNKSLETPIAIKIDSAKVPDLTKPVPWREIFVYSSKVEGVHLRGGAVARGGLRWSDRAADYRTEVLGLMKAQMTKNVVIVPVGAKGGFFVKQIPQGDRATVMAEVESCYRQFIRALLSVADNRIQSKIVAPQDVRRYDADDAYFVVAADKGTATFSDIANEEAINADYWPLPKGVKKSPGFWLGDAFASGGSQGYDHKGMGITARGAWESVKHHFKEIGKDIQKEEFTVVGIGDMAGDVFGNGMLLSKHIRLQAAFNHMHIFVDPNPDAAKSFKERQRLFKTPHTTWMDYNSKVLSKGGQIYERSAKSLKLTKEIKECFGISKETVTPNELIRTILQADVELLWNGGIGTYIKATQESHQDVADRTNDELRINGADVRARVIGEGGNLGVTQLGRVEYALNGGHINTDALDNAAGVNTSDVEVNIKILLKQAQEAKKLSIAKRNKLLADMTDEVATLVLRSNYLQAQAISLKERNGVKNIDTALRLQQSLTQQGLLDPTMEFLPTGKDLENRKREGKGYTRPELSVLMAYAKADIYDSLLASSLPDADALDDTLPHYFPNQLDKFKSLMQDHPLRREIIATVVTNDLVNRMGMTFLNRMRDETGFDTTAVAKAYLISSRLFEANRWWQMVELQSTKIPVQVQYEMYEIIKRTVEFGAFWFLRNEEHPMRIDKMMEKYEETFGDVYNQLETTLSGHKEQRHHQRIEAWVDQGLDSESAHAMGIVSLLVTVPDIAKLVHHSSISVPLVMQCYFAVGERLKLSKLHTLARGIAVHNNWERVATLAVIDELYGYQSRIAELVLAQANKKSVNPLVLTKEWLDKRGDAVKQYDHRVAELMDQATVNHAMMNVMLGQLKGLAS
ncbi:MAG: NAD-glutamate dehydrogenase [Alphaproteobacteria bacterium]|nr:NAD-glutamate dehydrogenase [Alphaproteobacteria bacterium]MDD9920563.1 NAD-glutamate dehydrogenase [Alphaproteobacteria bacterium]